MRLPVPRFPILPKRIWVLDSVASEPFSWEFQLSLNPSLNQLRGLHYQAYARLRRQYAREIWAQAPQLDRGVFPLRQATLQVFRYSAGTLDWDNALASLKPIVDCLLPASRTHPDGLGLLLDDSPTVLLRPPRLEQRSAPRGKGHVLLRVFSGIQGRNELLSAPLVRTWETAQLPPSLNTLRKYHVQRYKTLREEWGQFFGEASHPPLSRAWLSIETWRNHLVDWDNFYGGLKPLLDCLSLPGARNPSGQGWIVDDNPSVLAQPTLYQWKVTRRTETRTRFQLYGFH